MYTVLVCDDDIAILDSVEIYLKLEGYNVLRALLPTEQSQLLKDIYYKGTTQKQVAYSTNCSTRSIRRHHAKALNALHYKLTS